MPSHVKKGAKEPRSERQFERLSPRERARYEKAVAVVRRLRHGDGRESLTSAAKALGTTRQTVLRYAGSAFERNGARGRVRVRSGDRLVRRVRVRTPDGAQLVTVTGSRQASTIAKYNQAIDRFREGDVDALRPFRGRSIGGVLLETDPDVIEEAGVRSEPDFDEFYALTTA